MKDEDIKKSEFQDIAKGLAHSGKVRSAVFLGHKNGNLEGKISDLCNRILQGNPKSFWVAIDSQKVETPYDWCSQFARNLRTTSGVKLADLAKFALNTGKSLSPFKQPSEDSNPSSQSSNHKIAEQLVVHFEELLQSSDQTLNPPHLVIAVKELSGFSDEMLKWMGEALNNAFRKSKAFKGVRFLFSCESISDRENSFFDQFGFEKIHLVEIDPPTKKAASKNITEPTPAPIQSSTPKPEVNVTAESVSPKALKKNTLPSKIKYDNPYSGKMDLDSAKEHLSSFSEEEKKYLFLVSYPYRISRYTLEHFTNSREAALAFNWLSRQKSLYHKHPSGDLILLEDLRIASRTFHANANSEVAENWGSLSTVLDSFHEKFPIDSLHWIPINLQLLESFTKRILRNLFTEDQLVDLSQFIEQYEAELENNGGKLSIPFETKQLIRRFLELTGRPTINGLEERIKDLWLKDQAHYNSQKEMMVKEKADVTTEIESTLGQVAQLKELRDTLVEDFRNPKRNKAERVYSFTTSRLLLVIGLATVGASLLSESIGSYHAACGLALTLFGFFWPNVETKRPAFATEGPRSNLAIETQQRSLNHRVGSLSNRIQVMKGNLDAVEKQLAKLGDAPPPPYLDSEQSEG
ncbi:MAG: hypothetical protein O2908_07845 [Verrucomicrobia bacterium]|nr:hypothetical protein [Verrucomicrobiota bacterium]